MSNIFRSAVSFCQRRRIKRKDKAKVVASDWGGGGGEFIQFLAALAVLPGMIFYNRMKEKD